MEWADENLREISIQAAWMALPDDDGIWKAVDLEGRESYGVSIMEAIRDAQRDDDDPERWTYIPPEYRENDKLSDRR